MFIFTKGHESHRRRCSTAEIHCRRIQLDRVMFQYDQLRFLPEFRLAAARRRFIASHVRYKRKLHRRIDMLSPNIDLLVLLYGSAFGPLDLGVLLNTPR